MIRQSNTVRGLMASEQKTAESAKTPETAAETPDRKSPSLEDLADERRTMLDEMVHESTVASSVTTADADMVRLASELGFSVDESFEASALYRREMGDLIFRLEGTKNAESPNNGTFRGATVRIIGQNLDKLPPSVGRAVARGDLIMIPLGSFDDKTGELRSPVLSELDGAPIGSVWALQPPKYVPASKDAPGGFVRTPTSGDRSFYPYKLHRLSLSAK